MTIKDLKKVESFIERYKKLPKDAEVKYKTMFGNPTQEEKNEAKIILDEINSLFIDIIAFVKVKLGKDSSYIPLSNNIDFEPTMMGMAIHTNDKAMIERAWNNGMNKLGNMLESLKAEIKEIVKV